jgi:hypothetical protein
MLKIRHSINYIKVLCLAAVTIATSIGNVPNSRADEAIRINPGIITPVNPVIKSGSVSFFNRGKYTARYFLSYTLGGSTQTFDSGNIKIDKQAVFTLPTKASDIRVEGKYFDPIVAQKTIFVQNLNSSTANVCFTTTGTISNPTFNSSCNEPPTVPTTPIVRGNSIENGNFTSELVNWTAIDSVVSSFPTSKSIKVAIIRLGTGRLSQDFPTTAGSKYRVSFDVAKQFSPDRSQYRIFTNPRFSNVSHKLSDLSSTPSGEFDRYSFEINTSTSVTDTLNFTNSSTSARFIITNVAIEQIAVQP